MNERRRHCRISGVMVSDTTVRVRPGHDGALINLCSRGALIELRRPVAPGVQVDVQLSQGDTRIVIRALVLRCSVHTIAALDGVTYQAALLFDGTCDLLRAPSAPNGYGVPARSDAIAPLGVSDLPVNDDSLSAGFRDR